MVPQSLGQNICLFLLPFCKKEKNSHHLVIITAFLISCLIGCLVTVYPDPLVPAPHREPPQQLGRWVSAFSPCTVSTSPLHGSMFRSGGETQSHEFLAMSVTGGNIKWRKRERGKM